MVLQSLSDCIYKRSQVKEAVPEMAFVYQSYSFWLTALILVLLFETFPRPGRRGSMVPFAVS